jgi:hypothetical protein
VGRIKKGEKDATSPTLGLPRTSKTTRLRRARDRPSVTPKCSPTAPSMDGEEATGPETTLNGPPERSRVDPMNPGRKLTTLGGFSGHPRALQVELRFRRRILLPSRSLYRLALSYSLTNAFAKFVAGILARMLCFSSANANNSRSRPSCTKYTQPVPYFFPTSVVTTPGGIPT